MSSSAADIRITPTFLKRTVQELQERLNGIKTVADPTFLKSRISTLERKTSDSDFWTKQEEATRTLTEIKKLKKDLEAIEEMERSVEDLSVGCEMLNEEEISEEEENVFQVLCILFLLSVFKAMLRLE